jgi:hypothetical protein
MQEATMQQMYRYSSIARPLDPRYPTNLLIMVLTVVAGVVAGLLTLSTGGTFSDAILAGFATGGSTFLTWAIARETDPDYDWSAFAGVAFMWLAGLWLRAPMPGMVALALMLVYLRVINRMVGPPATIADAMVLMIGLVIASFLENWIIAVGVAGAFFIDGILPPPQRRQLFFALLALLIMVIRIMVIGWESYGVLSLPYLIGIAVVAIVFVLTMLATRSIRVGCDISDFRPDVRRIRASMALALGGALAISLWNGDQGVLWTLPAWCAMAGIALFRVRVTLQQWIAFRSAQKG